MSYQTERRIEFCDTDAAGIAHFSCFFKMMESAEHEMLRSLGLSVMPRSAERGASKSPSCEPAESEPAESEMPTRENAIDVTWPRVSASCDFSSAVRFEDVVTIEVAVARIGSSSVQYRFTFSCGDRPVASGSITSVCSRLTSTGISKTPIPNSIRNLLKKHRAE